MTKRKIEYWVIPPEQDAEFVANMEAVLETYETAYDPEQPVLCMDEQPVQLLLETRVPLPATKQHGERVDYEYERNGTASIFLFAEPLSGFRQATARVRRTKADWAIEVAQLLDTRYAHCVKVTLVCDNLNTHTKRGVLRGIPAGCRAGLCEADRFLSHAQTRQLAERGGMRTELPDQPMFEWPPDRRTGKVTERNRDRGRQDEPKTTRCRLEIQDRRRAYKIEATVPRD